MLQKNIVSDRKAKSKADINAEDEILLLDEEIEICVKADEISRTKTGEARQVMLEVLKNQQDEVQSSLLALRKFK